MKSHLIAIIERLNSLIEAEDPKTTYNFEKDGVVQVTISFDPEEQIFNIKYPKMKDTAVFDDIDLVAIEVFELIY